MVAAMPAGVRCAVIPPAPVPYREPLFAGLAARPSTTLRVMYQAGRPAGWDQAGSWFPDRHAYDALHLQAFQRERVGGTPVVWPRGLERALRSFGPRVVVVWEYGPAALRTWAWCARRGIPFVIFSENTPAIDERLPPAQLRLHRWLAARATGFIAASSAARARFVGLGVAADAVEVSLQSFDPEPIRAAVEQGGGSRASSGDGPVRFLTVARLVPDKNVGGLIEAFARSGLTDEEAELHIAGTGPLEGELRELVARLGVPARFAGYTAPDDLPAAYASADAFVLPSVFEPFGVVVREAVAAGLPVICSPTTGAAGDVAVAGRNALLVDPRRPDALGAALGRVARDDRLRAELARGSREVDRENGIERSVDAFERAVTRAAMFGA
jgi:glycosyltransferase involved in cell wall biosynthesis